MAVAPIESFQTGDSFAMAAEIELNMKTGPLRE